MAKKTVRPGAEARPSAILSLGGDSADHTVAPQSLQIPARLERAGGFLANALALVPVIEQAGFPSISVLIHGTAARLDDLITADEAMAGAMILIDTCAPEDAKRIAASLSRHFGAGPPPPPFFSPRGEARFWATWASPAEHKAYVAACWHRLSGRDRAAFIREQTRRGAA